MKGIYLLLLSIFVFGGNLLFANIFSVKSFAVSGSQWQAGRIIDDNIFTYKDAMSVGEIQQFLNQNVGKGGYDSVPGQCDSNGERNAQPYSSSTRAQYAQSLGRSTKFTCLKDYYEVPKTNPGPSVPANNYGGKPIPSGAKSAAQLIWDAAQRYNISPKVLLVTIQKESAGPLTTDDWPFEKQYTYAMGAHCPDSGPNGSANCDQNYSGFSIQISESARLFRYYLDNMEKPWWSYKKVGVNSILYHPNASCGSSNVNIQSKATAALYTYTPYQPNSTALSNVYGSQTDGCSSYGNRNFWRIYHDWFGNPLGSGFSAQYVKQSPYMVIDSGARRQVYFDFKNTGVYFWKDIKSVFPGYHPVKLAASNPINQASRFYDKATWPSASRPKETFSRVFESDGVTLSSDQRTVYPGQIARFEFTVNANTYIPGGVYSQYVQPILEGSPSWNMDAWAYVNIGVNKPTRSAKFHKQSSYPTLTKGGMGTVSFMEFRNTGSDPWFDDTTKPAGKFPTRLATYNPVNRSSQFRSGWGLSTRPAVNFSRVFESDGVTLAPNQHIVQPGQIGRFEWGMAAPLSIPSGTYNEHFAIITEGAPDWYMGWQSSGWLRVTVP